MPGTVPWHEDCNIAPYARKTRLTSSPSSDKLASSRKSLWPVSRPRHFITTKGVQTLFGRSPDACRTMLLYAPGLRIQANGQLAR